MDHGHQVGLVSIEQMCGRWAAMQVRARDVRYSPDGELIAITSREGGGTWFYSMPHDTWRYVHDHPTALCSGQFSPDGSR